MTFTDSLGNIHTYMNMHLCVHDACIDVGMNASIHTSYIPYIVFVICCLKRYLYIPCKFIHMYVCILS